MYDEDIEGENLSFDEIVDTLQALMDEDHKKPFKFEHAHEGLTERRSVFKRIDPIG